MGKKPDMNQKMGRTTASTDDRYSPDIILQSAEEPAQDQTQIGDIDEIIGPINLHDVRARPLELFPIEVDRTKSLALCFIEHLCPSIEAD